MTDLLKTVKPAAWLVWCPRAHEFDYLVFAEERHAWDAAHGFDEDAHDEKEDDCIEEWPEVVYTTVPEPLYRKSEIETAIRDARQKAFEYARQLIAKRAENEGESRGYQRGRRSGLAEAAGVLGRLAESEAPEDAK